MQSLLGAFGAVEVGKVLDAVKGAVGDAYSAVKDVAVKTAKILADPKKGVPLSIAVIKGISSTMPYVEGIDQGLARISASLRDFDPVSVLGPMPTSVVTATQIGYNQCSFTDIVCHIGNVGIAIANGLIWLGTTIVNGIVQVAWTIAYAVLKGLTYTAHIVMEYVVRPLVSLIVTVYKMIAGGIIKFFCVYVQYVAPSIYAYRFVESMFSAKTWKDPVFSLIGMTATFVAPMAFVASECGFALPQSTVVSWSPSINRTSYQYDISPFNDTLSYKALTKYITITDTVTVAED